MSDTRFAGAGVLVTGGAAGMGRACVEKLARQGARVCLFDRDTDTGLALAQALSDEGLAVTALTVDVSDETAFTAAFSQALESLGQLDILIQIAGGSRGGLLETQSLEDWDWHLRQNLRSTVLGCKLATAAMAAQGGGAIVNMSSISGLRGDPGWAAYNATKAAILNFTQSLAWEVGRRGVRVNAVCPGPVASARMIGSLADAEAMTARYSQATALGRLVAPEEVAEAILFLASDASAAITGHALVVDCGLTASTGQPIGVDIFDKEAL